jgi:hypothetical protein
LGDVHPARSPVEQPVRVGAVLVMLPLDRNFRSDPTWRLHLTIDKHQGIVVVETDFISEMKSLADGNLRIEWHRRNVFDDAAHTLRVDNRAVLPGHNRDRDRKSERAKEKDATNGVAVCVLKQKQAISKRKPCLSQALYLLSTSAVFNTIPLKIVRWLLLCFRRPNWLGARSIRESVEDEAVFARDAFKPEG